MDTYCYTYYSEKTHFIEFRNPNYTRIITMVSPTNHLGIKIQVKPQFKTIILKFDPRSNVVESQKVNLVVNEHVMPFTRLLVPTTRLNNQDLT